MPILFRCGNCRRKLSITRKKVGVQIQCPGCYKYITVPSIPEGTQTKKAATTPPPRANTPSNALESMNPEHIFQTPSNEKLTPPPPPVYLDEIEGDETGFDAVRIEPEEQMLGNGGTISWKAMIAIKKTWMVFAMGMVAGLGLGFILSKFLR